MTEGLVPSERSSALTRPADFTEWDETGPPRVQMHPAERFLAVIKRYRWLVAGVFTTGIAAGVVAMKLVTPKYEVQATIWIQSETPGDKSGVGPIRSQELLASSAWVELLRSYRIADAVVRKLNLYVTPDDADADGTLFFGFALADRYATGKFLLEINGAKRTWKLVQTQTGAEIDRGTEQDSVGRKVGYRWKLPADAFSKKDIRKVEFTVATPRETARTLSDRLGSNLRLGTNFLRLSYEDPNPRLAALTLNTWANEFVGVAGELKKKNLVEFSRILEEQLLFAQKSLVESERALEDFRVHTITLPAESGPVAAGLEMTRDPALKSFFDQRATYDDLRSDREAVEQTIAKAAAGTAPYEGLLLIPSVANSPGAKALRDAFDQLYTLKADLATKRAVFTDSVEQVKILNSRVATLQQQTIPALADQMRAQLAGRETEYARRIAGASKEMQAVPPRTIEEMRLRRNVNIADGLYTNLKSRYAEARLAEASAAADVNVLDSAVAPLNPSKNTAPGIFFGAVLGGLALAIGLAMILDRIDPKFRYPDQATGELGIGIAGVVPRLPKGGLDMRSPEQVLQLVESFRSLRMHIIHAIRGQVCMAISSAAPGDGKSLVSANLAMSFAQAGFRTVLVDSDTRRGSLNETFGISKSAGFTEFLAGELKLDDVVHRTDHENLSVVPCGRRHQRSPEFLASPKLQQLVETLKSTFDVVIFDTPPLAAGIDGYAVSAATGHLLMVLRIGKSDRRLAAAKLAVMHRLPVTIVGTVLNGVELSGEFQYYAYTPGYGIDMPELTATAST
jgi:polysaccharide biosynthesis transport protein